jgi:hypothetical protein
MGHNTHTHTHTHRQRAWLLNKPTFYSQKSDENLYKYKGKESMKDKEKKKFSGSSWTLAEVMSVQPVLCNPM